MLTSRVYIGEYSAAGFTIPDGMPRMVDDELFERVQQRIKARSHKKYIGDGDWWLTGHLYCGLCGAPVGGTWSHGRSKIYQYYQCSKAKKDKSKCSAPRYDKMLIESMVTELLTELLQDSGIVMTIALFAYDNMKASLLDNAAMIASLKNDITDKDMRISRIVDAIESGCDTNSVRERLEKLENEKKELQDRLKQAEREAASLNTVGDIASYYRKYMNIDIHDPAKRKAVLDFLIDKIYIFPDHIAYTLTVSDYPTDHMDLDFDLFNAYDGWLNWKEAEKRKQNAKKARPRQKSGKKRSSKKGLTKPDSDDLDGSTQKISTPAFRFQKEDRDRSFGDRKRRGRGGDWDGKLSF